MPKFFLRILGTVKHLRIICHYYVKLEAFWVELLSKKMNDCKKVLTLLYVQISQGLAKWYVNTTLQCTYFAMQGHSCLVSIKMA